MTCCSTGCCGPGSYCCQNTAPHTHEPEGQEWDGGHDGSCDLLAYGGPFEPDCGCRARADRARIKELEAEVERLQEENQARYDAMVRESAGW